MSAVPLATCEPFRGGNEHLYPGALQGCWITGNPDHEHAAGRSSARNWRMAPRPPRLAPGGRVPVSPRMVSLKHPPCSDRTPMPWIWRPTVARGGKLVPRSTACSSLQTMTAPVLRWGLRQTVPRLPTMPLLRWAMSVSVEFVQVLYGVCSRGL